ncbi:MAG: hypothetical protein ABIR70_19555 [Bryobacteraceae bacterium]
MKPLEQWLCAATQGLSPESAARVRGEIQQHYDSAVEAGDDPITALGDPKAANRGYRSVLITEYEQAMAPALTQAKPRSFSNLLVGLVFLAPAIWIQLTGKNLTFGSRLIALAIFSTLPFSWFFAGNTLERSRLHLYVAAVKDCVVVGLAWWFQGWISALTLGAISFGLEYALNYQRFLFFRKLASGQSVSPLPGEPQLTHNDAVGLSNLRKGAFRGETISIVIIFTMLGAGTVWQPATCAPMTAWMVLAFIARRTLPIYTEERSRWFRIAKWATAVVAGVLPVLYGAKAPWMGAAYIAFFCLLFDSRSIALRRKLPVSEWPKRLYW